MTKRKQSLFEDLINLAVMFPWWAGVLLAIVAYLVIHPFAAESTQTATSAGELGQVVTRQLTQTFASLGQYIVPTAFLIGAIASAISRLKRRRLLISTAAATQHGAVKSLSWQEFEQMVGEAFRQDGFAVQETPDGADGGVDLELRKGGECFLVQCKQWRATKVGVTVVRELFGAMAARGATGAFVVTSGSYTQDAKQFTEGRNITLIDGEALDAMIRRVRAKADLAPHEGLSLTGQEKWVANKTEAAEPDPACPACGGQMVKRVARRGGNAGAAFWGCARFPQCRGSRSI